MSKRYHPDKSGDHKSMSLINEAYGVLSNPEKRGTYNLDLQDFQQKVQKIRAPANTNTANSSHNKTPQATNHKQTQGASVKKTNFWRNFAFIAAGLILIFMFISYLSYLSAQKNEPKAVKEPTVVQDKIQTSREKQTEVINFKTITKENPDLLAGNTNVSQDGEDGERTITYQLIYKNGVFQTKQEVSDVITKEPIDKIVEVGTKKSESSNTETQTSNGATPTVICKDGSYAYDTNISNSTCKGHGGVVKLVN